MTTETKSRAKLPAELKPASVVALVDTREQTPLTMDPLRTEKATLTTGDYSIRELEHHVAIERKSLSDLIGCVGRERERFDREVKRLLAYPVRCLVIESTWSAMEMGEWRGNIRPTQVLGALSGWICSGWYCPARATHII